MKDSLGIRRYLQKYLLNFDSIRCQGLKVLMQLVLRCFAQRRLLGLEVHGLIFLYCCHC